MKNAEYIKKTKLKNEFSFEFEGVVIDKEHILNIVNDSPRMFNIDIPHNFNSPYKANSIIEFWDRWHMTLTRFLRKYVYFPMGGSKKGELRTYVNVLTVFIVSGIWHGASWTFILWGCIHGIANILNRIFNMHEELSSNGDFETQNLVQVTLLEYLWDENTTYNRALELLGEHTKKLWSCIENYLSVP